MDEICLTISVKDGLFSGSNLVQFSSSVIISLEQNCSLGNITAKAFVKISWYSSEIDLMFCRGCISVNNSITKIPKLHTSAIVLYLL